MTNLLRTLKLCVWQASIKGSLVLIAGMAALLLAAILVFAVFRFVDPPGSALMAIRMLSGQPVERRWVSLDQVSRHAVRAIVVSEDARFCAHIGIDLIEFRAAMARAAKRQDGAVRGASTISMQVVKNLLLWPEQHLSRKGLELAITPVMEAVWTKRRILEVYLNIAEWGPGIFGIEQAARHHFGKSARRLSRSEAALLAAVLPNPIVRNAGSPGPRTRRRARRIRAIVRSNSLDLSCLRQG